MNIDPEQPLDGQANCWALVAGESKVSFGDEEKVPLEEPLKLAMSDIIVRPGALRHAPTRARPLTAVARARYNRAAGQGCIFDQETGQIGFFHNGRALSFTSPLTARRLRGQLALAVSGTHGARRVAGTARAALTAIPAQLARRPPVASGPAGRGGGDAGLAGL